MYDCGPARRIQNRRQSAHEALQQLHARSGDGLIRADHVRGQKVHALRRKMGPHSGQMMLRGNQQNPGEALMSALLQSIANDMKASQRMTLCASRSCTARTSGEGKVQAWDAHNLPLLN